MDAESYKNILVTWQGGKKNLRLDKSEHKNLAKLIRKINRIKGRPDLQDYYHNRMREKSFLSWDYIIRFTYDVGKSILLYGIVKLDSWLIQLQ